MTAEGIKAKLEAFAIALNSGSEGCKPLLQELQAISDMESHAREFLYYKVLEIKYIANILNEFERAFECCSAIEDKVVAYDDKDILYQFYRNRGVAYQNLGKLDMTRIDYFKAIEAIESKGSLTAEDENRIGAIYYNFSIQYDTKEHQEIHRSYLKKATEYFTKNNHLPGLQSCYNSMAHGAYLNEDYHTSLGYMTQAYSIAQEIDDHNGKTLYANNLALLYAKMDDNERALSYFEEAEQLMSIQCSKINRAVYLSQRGDFFYANLQSDLALGCYLEAEAICIEIKTYLYTDILEKISESYAQMGDYQSAFQYLKKHTVHYKNQSSQEATNELAKASIALEIKAKEKETLLLIQQNRAIEQYARELEQSNEQLEQFAHITSHDLREPLRMIASYSQLITRSAGDKLTTEEKEYLQYIQSGAKRLDELIKDILQYSKVNQSNEIAIISLQEVLSEVIFNLTSQIQEANARIKSEPLPEIQGDKSLLIQLFQNLISNGIKYNQSLQPTIAIEYEQLNGHHLISFMDNGIGIAEQHRLRVFEIFERLHATGDYAGTGIGLAICKRIVDKMYGKIWIEANLDGGSIFQISLPLDPA